MVGGGSSTDRSKGGEAVMPCSICIRFVNETVDLNTQISTGVEDEFNHDWPRSHVGV